MSGFGDQRAANLAKLDEASALQDQTEDAILRMRRQLAESEECGTATLQQMQEQGRQMDDINHDLETMSVKIDKTQALQKKFDFWAGNWLGGKKRAAHNEAAMEIAANNKQAIMKVKEVYEVARYDTLSRTWKSGGLVLASDPSIQAVDVFDPNLQNTPDSSWTIDYSIANIDAEGWTYASDIAKLNKTNVGIASPAWNSYARRRKWKFNEKRKENTALDEVRARNDAAKMKQREQQQAAGALSTQAEKIGYVPRNRVATMKESGLTSAGIMKGSKTDHLDEDSQAGLRRIMARDAQIDEGLDAIGKSVDRLGSIAAAINEQAIDQNKKLEKIDDNMQKKNDKMTHVNARQRYLLK